MRCCDALWWEPFGCCQCWKILLTKNFYQNVKFSLVLFSITGCWGVVGTIWRLPMGHKSPFQTPTLKADSPPQANHPIRNKQTAHLHRLHSLFLGSHFKFKGLAFLPSYATPPTPLYTKIYPSSCLIFDIWLQIALHGINYFGEVLKLLLYLTEKEKFAIDVTHSLETK